jgi:hypothetical protein
MATRAGACIGAALFIYIDPGVNVAALEVNPQEFTLFSHDDSRNALFKHA